MGMEVDHIEQDHQQKQHQEPIFKHFCRVRKRGFGCAGALGGHMRSHAVGDVRMQSHHDQEIGTSRFMGSNINGLEGGGGSIKHSYFLRTNTNRCPGNKLTSSMSSNSESEVEEMMVIKSATTPAKSENYASSEEEDLANCLVMLSNKSFVLSGKEETEEEENKAKQVEKNMFQCKACKKVFSSHQALGGHRASHKKVKGCFASRFNNINNLNDDERIEDDHLINQLDDDHDHNLVISDNSSELQGQLDLDFSPQHDHHLPKSSTTLLSKRKSKEHQCSICHRVFSSGQALGGHKRCHWLTSNLPDNTLIQNLNDFQFDSPQLFKKPMLQKSERPPPTRSSLDLNFPPLLNNAVDSLNINSTTNPFNYEAPATAFLQLWGNKGLLENNNTGNCQQQKFTTKSADHAAVLHVSNTTKNEVRAKLCDLKDIINMDGWSSRWLQVGIASTTDITATP